MARGNGKTALNHSLLACLLAGLFSLAGCGGGGPGLPPPPTKPSISQTVSLANDVDIKYSATLKNLNSATRTITHNGAEMYETTISYSPYNETLENMEKGDYGFNLTAGSLSDKDSVTVPNYNPSSDFSSLDKNLNERYEGSSKTFNLESRVSDKNPEDMPVTIESATSLDGKTIVTLDGYNLTVKANGVGPYQVQVDSGSDEGGRNSSILSGNITAVPEQIACWSDRDQGTSELAILDMVNHHLRNIRGFTNNAVNDVDPAWSPDGNKLVFTSNRDFRLLGIYIMNNLDGRDLE